MQRLFHGTVKDFESPAVGGFDRVFWTAGSSAVAQTYIPASTSTMLWQQGQQLAHERVWPVKGDPAYSVAVSHMGKAVPHIEWDGSGRARSWVIPEGWPTYGEVEAYLRDELGYEVQDGRTRLKLLRYDTVRDAHVFAPASNAAAGSLWIVEGAESLRIYDFVTGREGDLQSPDYNRLGLFRRLEDEGWDGIRIHDFTQSEQWGTVGHESVGFFSAALSKLRFTRIEARHFDWPNFRTALTDVLDTPEYLDWLGRRTHDPLLCKAASLRRGEAVVMSDAEYDAMIDRSLYDLDMVSIPNPQRVGFLDALLCGRKNAKKMRHALREFLAQQEKRAA